MNDRMLQRISLAVALLVALLLPHIIYPVVALDILLWGLFAVAVNLLLSYGGLLSFGHAAFWGVAAYMAGYASLHWHLAFPLAVLLGMLLALLLALPIGFLSIRSSGIYFSMVTLAFAQMIYYIVNQWRAVTGGENGLQGIPRTFPGLDLSGATTFYYACLPIVVIGLVIAYRVLHSPFGHVVVAIRDNEARAKALGYPTSRYKLMLFVISATLSGLAGSLYSLGHGFAALDVVHWSTSGQVVIMAVLGGIGTLWGGLVGSAVLLLLRDWLSTSFLKDAPFVVTGVIFIVVVLAFRKGIFGTLAELLGRAVNRARRPTTPIKDQAHL